MTQQILIAGGGTVGLEVARQLEAAGEPASVTLVEPKSVSVYQPLLPEVASGVIDPRHAVVPLHWALRRTAIIAGEVCGLDAGTHRAQVVPKAGAPFDLDYDHLVVGVGAVTQVLPIVGLASRAVGLQTVSEALHLRDHVLERLHVASATDDPAARERALTVVVVGGGYSGVEIIGELQSMAHDACRAIPGLSDDELRFVLVEATSDILPMVRPSLRQRAREELERRSIDVRLETLLDSVEGTRAHLSDGSTVDADTLIWCAGVRPHPVLEQLGLPLDDQGRLPVEATLQVPELDGVWAAGDCAAVPNLVAGGLCPPSAQYALRQAHQLAANLARVARGAQPEEFRYTQRGELITLGRNRAVGDVWGIPLVGRLPWLARNAYHVARVPTATRKARLAIDWTVGMAFPRELAEFGSVGTAREAFEHAARATGADVDGEPDPDEGR